jgi:hypothetical protein
MAIQIPLTKKKPTEADKAKEIEKLKKSTKMDEKLKGYGFSQEEFEKYQHRIVPTDFPKPGRRFRLVLEYPSINVEQTYYWFLRYFQETWGFDKADKVIDSMASSVSSSIFGNLQTRLGAQQNQASQYLKGISEMIKGLFQIVREVRIIDDRLQYYYDSDGDAKGNPSTALSSEIVLKGLWIDQVEGGAKNPGSVYGLAQTIGFSILPDLFFRIKVKDRKHLEVDVDALRFNEKVKEVLKRKLRQYYEWKWRTKKELEQRRLFEIRYLRQHYDTIKLYMSWVKPYLRNIRRLSLSENLMDNARIIRSFETQLIEVETLFVRTDFGKHNAIVSLHLFHRARPDLAYHSYEYQHKGPIYSGEIDITLRAYDWTNDQIEKYKAYRNEDDLDLMSTIDKSVEEAMNSLGDELKKYLKEAGEQMELPQEEMPEEKKPSVLEPFTGVLGGFKEVLGPLISALPIPKPGQKKEKVKRSDVLKEHRAQHFAAEACWEGYYRYKMGPGGNIYWVE